MNDGRTLGRICHCIGVYTRNHRLEHECQVGDGTVTYGGKVFARYAWIDDSDVPDFSFYDLEDLGQYRLSQSEHWTIAQYRKRPYIDDPTVLMMIDYTIQEIKRRLTIFDANTIKWVRDCHEGRWEDLPHNPEIKHIQAVIEDTALSSSHGYLTPDRVCWKHLALCAIYDI